MHETIEDTTEEELEQIALYGLWVAVNGHAEPWPYDGDVPVWVILHELTARIEYLTAQVNELAADAHALIRGSR